MSILKQKQNGVAVPLTSRATITGSSIDDNQLVHRTGNETILGEKTFQNKIIAPTPDASANDSQVATTAFVKKQTQPDLSSERLVGTVFDTPLYERVISFTTPNQTGVDTEVLNLAWMNINEVVFMNTTLRDTSDAFVSVPYVNASRSIAVTAYMYQKKSFRVNVFDSLFLSRKGYVTLRYTKN